MVEVKRKLVREVRERRGRGEEGERRGGIWWSVWHIKWVRLLSNNIYKWLQTLGVLLKTSVMHTSHINMVVCITNH